MFALGQKVFAFPVAAASKAEVKEHIVLGMRINQNTAEVMYNFGVFEVPGYAVAETEEEAKEKLEKFLVYREELTKRVDEIEAFTIEFSKNGDVLKEAIEEHKKLKEEAMKNDGDK
ncbi:MAG: hypothetical protein MJZ20_02955 [Bacteroidaceae bacterium]|nr:hypothetical protein [Bacteroidaceae bacterium]